VTFADSQSGPLSCSFLHNQGYLSLERVTFANISNFVNQTFIQCSTAELLLNEGSAELLNVTIVGAVIFSGDSVIRTSGGASTNIGHLTVVDTNHGSLQGLIQGVILRAASSSPISVSNSIIIANGDLEDVLFPCDGPIIDNGGNFASSGECGFSTQLIGRASLGQTLEKGHDAWIVPLIAGSSAVNAGNSTFCEKYDGRGFERGYLCDSGAYEIFASSRGGELGRGGISGLYYTPETDGNYIQLQRAFDGNIVVIWNTFDSTGTQAWVYGVGSYHNGVVMADSYRNLGGQLQPGAGASTATVTSWGVLEVTVHNCNHITVEYESTDSNFGSGTFEAQRIAFVHDLGCSER